jgi:hypothetical protein
MLFFRNETQKLDMSNTIIDKPREKYLGRSVKKELIFAGLGTFDAYNAACSYLNDNGFNYGSTCVMQPMGFMKREWDIPWKWKNMTASQKKSVDGVMIGDMRSGPVELIFFIDHES